MMPMAIVLNIVTAIPVFLITPMELVRNMVAVQITAASPIILMGHVPSTVIQTQPVCNTIPMEPVLDIVM